MRSIMLALALWAGLVTTVFADDVMPPDPKIEATIQHQIDAFLADDFKSAFTFASPGIRSMFQTPENFGLMVRQGYPMVWRPEDVQFMDLRNVGGDLWQRVMVRDQTGTSYYLDYKMIETPDGWRIDGVTVLKAPGVGV